MPLQPSTKQRRRPARRTILRWVKRGLLGGLGLAIVVAIVLAWLPKPVTVDVATVRRGSLDVEVVEEGKTRVRDRFVVSAPISGMLQRIELDPGAIVEARTVIARIEPPPPALLDERTRQEARARLAAAIAHQHRASSVIARAKVARDAAAREAQRARMLHEGGAIAAAEREKADDAEQLALRDLAAAETERASAAAEAQAARAVLGRGTSGGAGSAVPVTSPIGGRVLRVIRDSAGPVAAGAELVELGDLDAIEVVVDVLSSDAARIRSGMPVAIEAWGGERSLGGEVRRVEPSAFTRISALGVEEQRVRVIVGLDTPAPVLGDGYRVEARIFTWRGDNVLSIPSSAVFRDQGRWAVYAIEDGVARLRRVELGHRGRLDVEIVGGLAEGDEIVLHPSDKVRDGTKVQRARP